MFAVIRRNRLILSAVFAAAVLVAVIVGLYSLDNKTNDMSRGCIESYGWVVSHEPVEISHLVIPAEFDSVYAAYNDLQKESGFDLLPYKGKKASRYSYRVLNHVISDEPVAANVLVCDKSVIGADISSGGANGFMHAISDTAQILK